MKWGVLIVALLAGGVIQTLSPSFVFLGGVKLPILPAIVLYYALTGDGMTMLVAAFLAGFLNDAMSQMPLGYSVFFYCLAGWLAGRFRSTVLIDSVLTTALFGGAAGAVLSLALSLLLAQNQLAILPAWRVALRMAGTGLLGAVVTPIVFWAVKGMDHWVGNVEAEQEIDELE